MYSKSIFAVWILVGIGAKIIIHLMLITLLAWQPKQDLEATFLFTYTHIVHTFTDVDESSPFERLFLQVNCGRNSSK